MRTRRKILVVDDDPGIGQLLQRLLQDEGLEPLVASDCAGALALAEQHLPDLAIVDIDLGQTCTGLDLLPHLRAWHTPVILLSAFSSVETRVRGLDLGADDYVTKPFGHAELLARIHACLRHVDGP